MSTEHEPTPDELTRCKNTIAAVLMTTFGYVPLNTRYAAADAAIAVVQDERTEESPTVAPKEPAAIEMVQQLMDAVHGDHWARPQSPKVVWEELLAEVRELAQRTV